MRKLVGKIISAIEKLLPIAEKKAADNVKKGLAAWSTDENVLKSYSEREVDALPEIETDLIKSLLFDKNGKKIKMSRKETTKKLSKELLNRRIAIPTITLFGENLSNKDFAFMQNNKLFDRFEFSVDEMAETHVDGHLKFNGNSHPLIQLRCAGGDCEAEYADFKQAIKNGITVDGQKYHFLLSSAAQTRTDGAWFVSDSIDIGGLYNSLTNGDWSKGEGKEKVIMAKFAKYLGLAVTTAEKVELNRNVKLAYIDSIIDVESGREYSDGCFICRRSFMKEILRTFKNGLYLDKAELGTAIQIRGEGPLWSLKGMMMSIPDKLFESRFGDAEIAVTGTTLKVKISPCPEIWQNATIWVVNTFDSDNSEKDLSFMFTINMTNPEASMAINAELEREFKLMENALHDPEALIAYLGQEHDGIQVADILKSLVAVNPDAIKDPLIFDGIRAQFRYKIEKIRAGKLGGLRNQCFLPDPSVFFEGKWDGKKIVFDAESKKKLLLRGNEVVTTIEGDEVIIMRSPSNHKGQIVKATNKLEQLPEKITLNGIEVSKKALFYLDTQLSNFIWFSQDSDMLLCLGGADEDGDTAKVGVYTPSKSLIDRYNGNWNLINAKIGPWHKAFKEGKPFIAIGDTKGAKVKEVLSYEALCENKIKSLVKDNTGIITNNAFFLGDLKNSLLLVPTDKLFVKKVGDKYEGLITSNMLFVLSRMAYSAMTAVKKNLKYYEERFDDGIVAEIKATANYWNYINKTVIDNGSLNQAMFAGKVAEIKAVFDKNTHARDKFIKHTALFLHHCLSIMCHLQMIQIDAATTNNYPELRMFNFARLQQKKGNEMINIRPNWFIAVKGKNHDKGVYISYSSQGFIFKRTNELAADLANEQVRDPKPLFEGSGSAKIIEPMKRFFNNLYQASSLLKDYNRVTIDKLDKDATEEIRRVRNSAFKSAMRLKAEPFYNIFAIEEVLKAAYAISNKSLKVNGSKVRKSAFLTYFGEAAVMYFSQKNNTRMYKASITEEYYTSLLEGKYNISVRDGDIFLSEYERIGSTSAIDGIGTLEFNEKNGYWINILPSSEVPGTIQAAMATSKTGVANINGKEVIFKVALANYKGKPVKVMEVYRSGRKHGCIVSEDMGKVMHLANKSGVIYIDEEDIELGKNKVRVSIIA